MRTVPARLGELLEKRGDVTREQLLRALRNQKVLGGRLGTCLLEIEAISEEQLCSALAEQQGVPSASPEDLRGIPDDVLEMLPAKVAKRCQAIAFQASTTQVKVALIDARNLAHQDEISFVVGKRIRWHVAPELRLFEALEKHHGEECPARLAKLLDRMNRSRFLWARESAATAAVTVADRKPRPTGEQLQWDSRIAGVAPQEPLPVSPVESPESVSVELPHFQHQALDLPTLAPMASISPVSTPAPAAAAAPLRVPAQAPPVAPPPEPAMPPAPVPAPSATPGATKPTPPADSPHRRVSVEETETRLLRPRERDDVARAVVDFAAGLVQRVVLFVVRKDGVAAWLWSGAGLDAVRLAALRLRLQQPSLFDGLKEQGGFFRGPLSPLPAHVSLAACFTAPAISGDVCVLPLKVKERLVAALLFEPRSASGAELAPADLADLQRVIAKAEIGFELCIMQSKLRKA